MFFSFCLDSEILMTNQKNSIKFFLIPFENENVIRFRSFKYLNLQMKNQEKYPIAILGKKVCNNICTVTILNLRIQKFNVVPVKTARLRV